MLLIFLPGCGAKTQHLLTFDYSYWHTHWCPSARQKGANQRYWRQPSPRGSTCVLNILCCTLWQHCVNNLSKVLNVMSSRLQEVAQNTLSAISAATTADADDFVSGVTRTFRARASRRPTRNPRKSLQMRSVILCNIRMNMNECIYMPCSQTCCSWLLLILQCLKCLSILSLKF